MSNETDQITEFAGFACLTPLHVDQKHKGRWPKQEATKRNVNVLNPGRKADMGESTSVHSVEVTVGPSASS